jgi:hypothetical protein
MAAVVQVRLTGQTVYMAWLAVRHGRVRKHTWLAQTSSRPRSREKRRWVTRQAVIWRLIDVTGDTR